MILMTHPTVPAVLAQPKKRKKSKKVEVPIDRDVYMSPIQRDELKCYLLTTKPKKR